VLSADIIIENPAFVLIESDIKSTYLQPCLTIQQRTRALVHIMVELYCLRLFKTCMASDQNSIRLNGYVGQGLTKFLSAWKQDYSIFAARTSAIGGKEDFYAMFLQSI